MEKKITYAVFYKSVETNYDPHPVWHQFDGWEDNIERVRHTLSIAKRNPRFAEVKIVKRTETLEDYEGA